MVQFIPRPKSFGDQVAEGIGQGASAGIDQLPDILEKIKKNRDQQQASEKFKNQFGFDLPAEGRNEFFKAFGKAAGGQPFKEKLEAEKLKKEQAKKDEESQGLRDTLDWLDENVEYTGTTGIPGLFTGTKKSLFGKIPGTESYGKRKEYDAAGFWAADKIYTHFNKGVISDKKLQVLRENLSPNSDLSERENKARISALRRISNLPSNISPNAFNKQLDKEMKAFKKISPDKKERPPLESFYE